MWDTNQSWQSKEFKDMLIYERKNDREKFIYDVNQILNAYNDINHNFSYLIGNDDPQLLALIFSLISITYNKDDLSDYIKNEDLSDYMSTWIKANDEFSSTVAGHTFRRMPEKNLNIGEQFSIPQSTLTIYVPNVNGRGTRIFDINDWEFNYDSSIVSINNGVITSLKKGCIVIECVNKKYNETRRIKINSGNVKQSYITEFFFTQIRNIIAHGRFTLINSGAYDTLSEYGKFNMSTSDNRYKRGLQRDLLIFENNQLNVAYDRENTFNPKYLIYLAKTIYAKENNPFIKFINIFDDCDDFVEIRQKLSNLSLQEQKEFQSLILLAKFYINFIYNYDSNDKDDYDYNKLSINQKLKGDITNKEFIYEIRTAIMHGRYKCQNNEFIFWNNDKKDQNIKIFNVTISYDEFIKLFLTKEEYFYDSMKYNPDILISNRKNSNKQF